MIKDNTRQDMQMDSDGDLAFSQLGDFIYGPSDEQHIFDTIVASPCSWKQYPDFYVNIRTYLGGPVNIQEMTKLLRLQLSADGYTCSPTALLMLLGQYLLTPNVNKP